MTFTPTDDQRRAIEAEPGPVLVLAGPGAGKTHCLIGRVHHLITARGCPPERICAVTYTNRAANEIAERLEREIGEPGRHVTRGTLHWLCLGVLREWPEAAGLQRGFGIADDEYQKALLQRLRVPEDRRGPLLTLFGRHRLQQYRLTPDDERLLEEYTGSLRRRNLVDFDEIVLRTHELFLQQPDLLARVAGRWDAVLVDEFQDLSATQYAIIRQLTDGHRQVFAVGDDEQSIFGWAGANPEVLADFRRDFGITAPVVLEENHRCARQIFSLARRILRANPRLFDKELRAPRESPYPVRAVGFGNDTEEAAWLVADLQADRAASGLRWGDFGILYRRHQLGNLLERALVGAGIPVRTARGRALSDDKIIAQVLGSLRILADPSDPVPVEALARLVLGEHTIQRAVAEAEAGQDLLAALRLFHRRKRGEPWERKAAMRLVYHVENLPGLMRSARTLGDLVDALLLQRPAARRSQFEERADELTDPRDLTGVPELAADLARVKEDGGLIHVPAHGGLEMALRGMLSAAGFSAFLAPEKTEAVGPLDLRLPSIPGNPVRLFKALQLLQAVTPELGWDDCVTFDLETTDNDPEACGIIEIGAARLRGGRVEKCFHQLVRPDRPIAAPATRVHGYTDADVAEAPTFAEVWPDFRAFIGDDPLVAHNGIVFDVPVLKRHVAQAGGEAGAVGQVFDTLPLARMVFRESVSLDSLAHRFGVDQGRAHHALDDAVTLAHVLRGLAATVASRARRTAFLQGVEWLGLALALEPPAPGDTEGALLLDLARFFTLGRYSEALDRYADAIEGRDGVPSLETVIDRLGGRDFMRRLRREKTPAERFPTSVARLRALLDNVTAPTVAEGIRELLDLAALSASEGAVADRARVNLLTLHATKGLEFSRVYVVGVEDYQLPGYQAVTKRLDDEFPEARRLLYVGMTRARDRLTLTRADQRARKPSGGSRFLDELGVTVDRMQTPSVTVPG